MLVPLGPETNKHTTLSLLMRARLHIKVSPGWVGTTQGEPLGNTPNCAPKTNCALKPVGCEGCQRAAGWHRPNPKGQRAQEKAFRPQIPKAFILVSFH